MFDTIDIMVGVAQLVELSVVVRAVAGSNPVAHPIFSTRRRANVVMLSPFVMLRPFVTLPLLSY